MKKIVSLRYNKQKHDTNFGTIFINIKTTTNQYSKSENNYARCENKKKENTKHYLSRLYCIDLVSTEIWMLL